MPFRVLMVCMGNICRSPTAEGVLRQKLQAAGLADLVEVDSAGTHAQPMGTRPDKRAIAAAAQRGYALGPLRARQVTVLDFDRFDLILAMDEDNKAFLKALCPVPNRAQVSQLMAFAAAPRSAIVPDPYYGSAQGFANVMALIEDACDGLVIYLSRTIQLPKQ